jgi:threonine 3-dehydrogenase
VLGEGRLITGRPARSAHGDRGRAARGRAVRRRLSQQVRRELAGRMGATLVVDPTQRDLKDAQHELGMVEGFDVAMEMSGNAAALASAIANMAHGGGIAILGIPTAEISLDVTTIVFNQLSLRGIYGREMYETWYKMSVMLQSGLDIRPAITHRFGFGSSRRRSPPPDPAARAGRSGRRTARGDRWACIDPQPLAFLDDEWPRSGAAPLSPAARDEQRQGPIVSLDGRRVISLPRTTTSASATTRG